MNRVRILLVALSSAAASLSLLTVAGCGNRLSAGGSGRSSTVVVPPVPLSSEHPVVGLVSAAGGAGRVRVDWRVGAQDLAGLEFALFVGATRDTVFAATPIPIDVAAGHALIDGLPSNGERFVGIGLRGSALDAFAPTGPTLSVHTSAPRYVDLAAPAGTGDGLTPATPTSDLVFAVLDAFVNGGGSVFVTAGDVVGTSVPLFTGVSLCGGFAPDFALETRDPAANVTRFVGAAGQSIVRFESGAAGASVLDGVTLEGTFAVPQAVDVPGLGGEVRDCVVAGTSRGFKVRGVSSGPKFALLVTGCDVAGCELEGLSVDAAVDLTIESSTFDRNGNEGVDLNHLWSPSATNVSLVVRGSRFTRNGTEGLDAHLGVPVGTLGAPGTFTVDVVDCDFEVNALSGLRVDVDYEAFPTWSADISVRGSRARGNGAAGIHYDLDSNCTATVHRAACTANGTDGFLLTSESYAGVCTLSCSALVGNLGHGAQLVQGNFALLASGCVVSGNAAGGFTSPVVPSTVHSTIACQQPSPWTGFLALDVATQDAASPSPFLVAPSEYVTIVSQSGDALTLAEPPVSFGRGATFESADDGTPRAVTSVIGATLLVAPVVAGLRTPARGAFFSPGASGSEAGHEDWRLASGSIGVGAGLSPVGAPPSDAGPFARFVGGPPGREDLPPRTWFRVASTSPAVSQPIAANAEIHVAFAGGIPDAATAPGAVLAYSASGALLGTVSFVQGDRLVIAPPASGWHEGDRVEVHTTLRAVSGAHLGQAAVLRVRTP